MPLHGWLGNAQHFRHLLVRESGKKSQFHKLRPPGVMGRQLIQRFVQSEQLFIVHLRGEFESFNVDARRPAAVADVILASRVINQDAPHRFRCRGEKMGAVLPLRLVSAAEPEPGFVDEGRGLQSLAGIFTRHLCGGEFAQLFVHERQQFGGGVRIALIQPLQDDGEFAHAETNTEFRPGIEAKKSGWRQRNRSVGWPP